MSIVVLTYLLTSPPEPSPLFHPFVFSERELTFTFAVVVRPSVCLSSVTLGHPTQTIEIFGNVLRRLVRWTSVDFEVKFYGDRPRGTPPLGVLNQRGEAKYRDFRPLQDYISETMQDRR